MRLAGGHLVACAIPPEFEIVPGVLYGRPDELLSPAYWHWRCSTEDAETRRFVSTNGTLREEVGFCLLGGFSITRELNEAYFVRLKNAGVFSDLKCVDRAEIEELLRAPTQVKGRTHRYRFPKQRSHRIAEAMKQLDALQLGECDASEFRDRIAKLEGVGPKTASWIARNWLGADNVAIIDIHVLRAGTLIGLFDPNCKLPRDYRLLENRFIEFASALEVRASLLDLVIWSDMRMFGSRLASRTTGA